MPQFDASTFPSQLIWLAIFFVLLYVVLSRVALPRISSVLEERQRRIGGDLEKAESLRAEAETVLADYEKAMTEARAQAQNVLRDAKNEMAAEAAKREQDLAEKIAASTAEAEARIESARDDALRNMRQVAIEVTQEATKRLIDMELDAAGAEAAVDAVSVERK